LAQTARLLLTERLGQLRNFLSLVMGHHNRSTALRAITNLA
jgi:hypothetical protein